MSLTEMMAYQFTEFIRRLVGKIRAINELFREYQSLHKTIANINDNLHAKFATKSREITRNFLAQCSFL